MASITLLVVLLISLVSVAVPQSSGNEEWGYVEVRPGANMFWWLYKTTAGRSSKEVRAPTDRPLVIWLQGGPGAGSTGYGNFQEIGPMDEFFRPRNSSWVNYVNVLFIDNPVGTGYSYVTSSDLYTTNNAEIAADLLSFMKEFLSKNPEWQNVPLYIFSESYGGKMAAEFGLSLYKAKQAGEIQVNIKGVTLGDSWISPIDSVMTWAPFLLNCGVVDQNGYEAINSAAESTKNDVEQQNWEQATNDWSYTESVVLQETDNVDFYNILYKIPASALRKNKMAPKMMTRKDYESLLFQNHVRKSANDQLDNIMNGQIREKLGIPSGVYWGGQSGDVFSALYGDFMRPVTSVVEELLDTTNLQVAVLTGQLDLIVDTPGTLKWVNNLQWSGSGSWQSASRNPVVAGGYIEGFSKKYDQLSMYWVLRAGHMIPTDNPNGGIEVLRQITKFA
ncbi:retinoid-inducible serine carboxypeptidase-like [Ischnura elegans]|uniref:retinoid-inducible serine carboxypeptidase-like n=1 Tax=Ischnura elegans TaxID=197161 RepID=UPI001ED89BFF|nr:retinoid-inducible serine carboxypeptidase-like [Ischnura elegans]